MRTLGTLCLGAALLSCGPGGGTLRVALEPEETITGGIPAQTGGAGEGFADGWSLQFTRFYVNIGHVAIADQQGARVAVPGPIASSARVYDLRGAAVDLFTATDVPARRYDRVSYRLLPVTASTAFADAIPAADRAAMVGFSTWVSATATKGARTVRIDWRFREGYEFYECARPEGEPGEGVVVAQGGNTVLRLSPHGDHWFWQALGMEGSPTRFDPIANADTSSGPYRGNGDGVTTLEELDAVALVDIPAADATPRFDTGGRPVRTLGEYMRATTATIGHIDGDGVCASRPATM